MVHWPSRLSGQPGKRKRPYSWRRRVRRSPFPSPLEMRGGKERRAAHPYSIHAWRGVGASDETRAPFGAPSLRPYGAGPRFLTFRFASPPALRRQPLLGGRVFRASGKPYGPPSASSSQGILVSSGGAPAPPERGGCVHPPPAGATSDPACMTPHDSALGEPDAQSLNPLKGCGDKFSRHCDCFPRAGLGAPYAFFTQRPCSSPCQ